MATFSTLSIGASKITSAFMPFTGYSGTFDVNILMLLDDFTKLHITGALAKEKICTNKKSNKNLNRMLFCCTDVVVCFRCPFRAFI